MIETKRMYLYVVTKERYKALKAGKSIDAIVALKNWPDKAIDKLIRQDIKRYKNTPGEAIWGTYVCVLKETGEIIGDVGYKGGPDYLGEVEIGYGINESHRKKGYGFEAAEGLVKHALSKVTVDAVIAECRVDNLISQKILESLNMKEYESDQEYKYYRIRK